MHELRRAERVKADRRIVDDDEFRTAVSHRLADLFGGVGLFFFGLAADKQDRCWRIECPCASQAATLRLSKIGERSCVSETAKLFDFATSVANRLSVKIDSFVSRGLAITPTELPYSCKLCRRRT